MSDRGYLALALEIEAKAIQCRVRAMAAANEQHSCHAAYPSQDFFQAETELEEIAKRVRDLA